MQAVILAGGLGTRISEETHLKPKPMIEIGSKPIIWHIMKLYSFYGINDFIICCGYKGYVLKEFFSNMHLHNSDVCINLEDNSISYLNRSNEPWRVTLVDTGLNSMTGGRIKKIEKYISNQSFCLTYGDGLANIDIEKLIESHKLSGKIATVTAVRPPSRFGKIHLDNNNNVNNFSEKPIDDEGWINGGFFVLDKRVFDLIDSDNTIWEKEPLNLLAKQNQLNAYKHNGFWSPMDTLRDKNYLENLCISNEAPWIIWK
jgi:glucose-1-phosphate cytidylyltransferase